MIGLVSVPELLATAGGHSARFCTAAVLTGILAFGLAALLFLATEELLFEAHETSTRRCWRRCFFVGFFVLYALDASH